MSVYELEWRIEAERTDCIHGFEGDIDTRGIEEGCAWKSTMFGNALMLCRVRSHCDLSQTECEAGEESF